VSALGAAADWLADPWRQEILRRAFLETAFLGIAGGVLGCWIVLYGLSYGAESLAHALLPGLVVAALTGAPLLLGGAVGLLVAALGVAFAGRAPGIGADAGVAVVVTALLGLGALLALAPATPPGLGELLFGDPLGVTDLDLALAGGLVLGLLLALRLLHGRLLAVGFDRGSARALGAPPLLADVALLILIAAAILVAVQGLGNLLVVAVLVGPSATARLLTRRVPAMMALAALIGVLCGVAGLYLSYHAGTAAGASIAGALVGAYLLAAAADALGLPRRRRARVLAAPEPA
jgi:ABC-type Mn2+/Zn2+ transport system permease subunit